MIHAGGAGCARRRLCPHAIGLTFDRPFADLGYAIALTIVLLVCARRFGSAPRRRHPYRSDEPRPRALAVRSSCHVYGGVLLVHDPVRVRDGPRLYQRSRGGEQGYAEITTASAVIGANPTQIAGLSVTFVPIPGRQYMAEFDGSVVSNANGDLVVVYIDTSHLELAGCGTTHLHFSSASKAITLNGSAPYALRFSKRFVRPPSDNNSTLTFTVSAAQLSGSNGQVYANACQSSALRVIDVGPADNPRYS